MTRASPLPHLIDIAAALRAPGQPQASFATIEKATAAAIGQILFTVLLRHEVTGEAERFWTSHPKEYPVGGRKPLNPTVWTEHVLKQQRPYLGNDYEAVKAVFFDHELIRSLGCESVLNIPVVWNGRSLGTINLLHKAGWYREEDIATGQAIAALAVPAYLMLVDR